MNKSHLLKKLEEVSVDMDNFLGDSTLLTAVKEFREIQGKLDRIINDIEDDRIETEVEKEEE